MHRCYEERPIELSSLAKVTGVRFASVDLVEMAVCCIEEITAEIKKDESKDSCAVSSAPSQKVDEDKASQEAAPESAKTSTEGQTSGDLGTMASQSTSTDAAASKPASILLQKRSPLSNKML